ncbi:hypothetical protein Tsubulata_050104 [Turnera subulata]|uniref:Uncharacterized protein n=1 Tax=Turnera subulata TaxID=218843 RepID=A0A9Q0FG50_9ROSI|nr:hypothetical protein Tsubulata_033966 [Turnera subulata]KAJ4847102.1 hypothetical protein Tsubulata_050104 [Turnera subulata]
MAPNGGRSLPLSPLSSKYYTSEKVRSRWVGGGPKEALQVCPASDFSKIYWSPPTWEPLQIFTLTAKVESVAGPREVGIGNDEE